MKRGPKTRNETVREARRLRIAELYLRGTYQSVIAQQLGVTQPQVSYDLQIVRKEWLASRIRNFDEAKEIELRKIDCIEREAWRSWEKSLRHFHSTRKETGTSAQGRINKKTVLQEGRYGDPRFLQIVGECIDKRTEILGLNALAKIAPTDPTGKYPYSEIDLDKLSEKELEQLRPIIAKSQGEAKS